MNNKTIYLTNVLVALLHILFNVSEGTTSMKSEKTEIDSCLLDQLVKTEIKEKPDHNEIQCSLKCHLQENCVLFSYNELMCKLFQPKWKTLGCSNRNGNTMKVYKNEKLKDYDCSLDAKEHSKDRFICEKDAIQTIWILVQRRVNGTVAFDRTWTDYKTGFGHSDMGYWIGNEMLHQLTTSHEMRVRFDLWDKDDKHRYAEYNTFRVMREDEKYKLVISGYSGNAGDGMTRHSDMKFSTKDQDNDITSGHCSQMYGGGWWYASCHDVNINGIYETPGTNNGRALCWDKWQYEIALKKTEMKVTVK